MRRHALTHLHQSLEQRAVKYQNQQNDDKNKKVKTNNYGKAWTLGLYLVVYLLIMKLGFYLVF